MRHWRLDLAILSAAARGTFAGRALPTGLGQLPMIDEPIAVWQRRRGRTVCARGGGALHVRAANGETISLDEKEMLVVAARKVSSVDGPVDYLYGDDHVYVLGVAAAGKGATVDSGAYRSVEPTREARSCIVTTADPSRLVLSALRAIVGAAWILGALCVAAPLLR